MMFALESFNHGKETSLDRRGLAGGRSRVLFDGKCIAHAGPEGSRRKLRHRSPQDQGHESGSVTLDRARPPQRQHCSCKSASAPDRNPSKRKKLPDQYASKTPASRGIFRAGVPDLHPVDMDGPANSARARSHRRRPGKQFARESSPCLPELPRASGNLPRAKYAPCSYSIASRNPIGNREVRQRAGVRQRATYTSRQGAMVAQVTAAQSAGGPELRKWLILSPARVVESVLHTRLKIARRKACRFESDPGHQQRVIQAIAAAVAMECPMRSAAFFRLSSDVAKLIRR